MDRETERPHETRPVNVGELPLGKYLGYEQGREQRKNPCEDQKINDPSRGLFLVADGVSTANGAVASETTARVIAARLGKALDVELSRIAHSSAPEEKKPRLAEAAITSSMIAAVRAAHEQLQGLDLSSGKVTATTLSLAKLIRTGSHGANVFFTNFGDSRIYRMRDGLLRCLTNDDRQEAGSSTITAAVGFGRRPLRASIETIDLRSGDRLLLTSDGITDNLPEEKIAELLKRTVGAKLTERVLQTAADEAARLGPPGHVDDISAVLYDFSDAPPVAMRPRNESVERPAVPLEDPKKELFEIDKKILDAGRRLRITPLEERLKVELEVKALRIRRTELEALLAKSKSS